MNALVFQAGGRDDDNIQSFALADGCLSGFSMGLGQEFQARNMDRPGELPAAPRVRMNQRREQLHQSQKADDGGAGGLQHWVQIGKRRGPYKP